MAPPDATRGPGGTGTGRTPPPGPGPAAPAPTDPSGREPPHPRGVFLGFAPWIVFDVVASPSTWKYAALAALVTALVLNVPELRHGSLKVLEAAGVVFFAVVCVLGLVLDRQELIWLETYAQTLSNGVIAAVALGSLAFTPFTEQYARESVPREYWDSPVFRRTNRVLTAVWGGVFLVTALLGLLALRVTSGADWLNWVVPIAMLVAAVRFTKWYPAYVRARAGARNPARTGSGAGPGDRGGDRIPGEGPRTLG
ncbi:hypothetical protein [Streptomyces sp. NPDC059466]|uniref:hypothetical protein n=1 Tax=unclassified Streptomyces TaxID=2593676 RepID=UPI0036AB6D31